ncbi:MAG: two-component sensor histidine kinase, partial [Flavobacteriaceae bacterium]|nr:two-component sensor histidine kinase [Flavobacteriaceae bacterium]
IGSHLTFIISSLDSLKYKHKDFPAADSLTGISGFTKQTIYELRDTIWAMNKNDISFEDLQTRISNFINQAKIASNETTFSFTINDSVNKQHLFTSVEGMNVYRIIQEAVNNASKYANSTEISVTINETESHFNVIIKDNGNGFEIDKIKQGNGLSNIKKRAKDMNGLALISSEINKGTSINIELPK